MSTNEATEWARGRGETVDCEIVDVQKMREAMNIFTTYECVFKTCSAPWQRASRIGYPKRSLYPSTTLASTSVTALAAMIGGLASAIP